MNFVLHSQGNNETINTLLCTEDQAK